MKQTLCFSIKDICNLDEAIAVMPDPGGRSSNPHNTRGFILHDHGFVITVVFAEHLQHALDTAADRNTLDEFLIGQPDYAEYGVDTDDDTSAHLGNAGRPFDIENLAVVEFTLQNFFSQLAELEIVI